MERASDLRKTPPPPPFSRMEGAAQKKNCALCERERTEYMCPHTTIYVSS